MFYRDSRIPEVVSKLIDKLLDEDLTYPEGTSKLAAEDLLNRAVKLGRERSLKDALKFWRDHPAFPQEIFWQWFNGVFLTEEAKEKPVKSVKKAKKK